ncbi:unnamed protein product [Sphagnum troendelagicum]|uniref:Malectin-like domain-containing protein n=1 Tax=Sphagnum troendelagicum TaxID=128251 RepID=A0ABP0U3T7_9BRYO
MDKPKRIWKAMLTLLIAVLEALVCTLSSAPGVWAQIEGSIFVDCGWMVSSVGSITNISWVRDAPEYITTGVNGYVPSAPSIYPNFSEFTTVRYFPDTRAKYCYSFPVMPKCTYVIRGTFFYGYYDNGTTLPSFQMAIDGTIVANVTFDNAATFVYHEFMVASVFNVIFLCLLRDSTNSVPFIFAISFSFLQTDFFSTLDSDYLYGIPRKYFETKYRLNFSGDGLVSSQNFYLELSGTPGDCLLNPYSNGSNSVFNAFEETFWDFLYTPGTDIVLYPDKTVSSPLGPIANTLEFWQISTNSIAPVTENQDAIAIEEIKSSMNLTDWTGDPCVPVPYPWVTCSTDSNFLPSITAVNLSGYNPTGPISPSFGNLLSLTSL